MNALVQPQVEVTKLGKQLEHECCFCVHAKLHHLIQGLGRAEAISGMEHPRVMPSLVLLGNLYTHTERLTFGEGLYRSSASIYDL